MEQEQSGGTGTGHREVQLRRTAHGEFDVENVRGGRIHIGTGEGADFTPVELLLAAIAGCSAVDVDFITGKRAEPERFEVLSEGVKVRDERGNHLDDIAVTFTVTFPEGEAGDRARERGRRPDPVSRGVLALYGRYAARNSATGRD